MKNLVLLAIVATSIVGATTAFATSNFINITGVQSLGASNDVNIPTDITAASIDFSTCENTPGGTATTPGTTGQCPAGTPATVLYGISDCTVRDNTDKNIPNGELITCKLTNELCPPAGQPQPTTCSTGKSVAVIAEGTLAVAITGTSSNIGGTVTAAGTVDCSVPTAPCQIDIPIQIPGPAIDVQSVGDVKIVAKGPQV